MWALVVVVLFALDGGGVREERFNARVQFPSQAECLARGAVAVEEATRLSAVVGAGFVCAPAPVT